MSITFEVVDDGKTKSVSYDGEITIESFIRDYLQKYTNLVSLSDYTFSFGSKVLNMPRFLNKKLKDMIQAGSSVTLVRKNDLHY